MPSEVSSAVLSEQMPVPEYNCTETSQADRIPESEAVSSQYVFVRSRELEGTYPGDGAIGTWPITPFRRQGIGTQLAKMAMKLSAECRRPLRMWIPFADWSEANLPIIKRLAARMQLQLFHSDVRWAAAQAIDPETVPTNPWKQD
jgi:hypothetical protein